MATKLGTNATKIAAVPAQLAEQGETRGRMLVHYDEFQFTADLAANDIIVMGGLLPAGARILDVVLDSSDLDTSSAGALISGWAASADAVEVADDNGFLTTVDVHTAGKAQSMSALLFSNCPGKFKRFASAVQPQIVISGETDSTTGIIKQAIYYVVD